MNHTRLHWILVAVALLTLVLGVGGLTALRISNNRLEDRVIELTKQLDTIDSHADFLGKRETVLSKILYVDKELHSVMSEALNLCDQEVDDILSLDVSSFKQTKLQIDQLVPRSQELWKVRGELMDELKRVTNPSFDAKMLYVN